MRPSITSPAGRAEPGPQHDRTGTPPAPLPHPRPATALAELRWRVASADARMLGVAPTAGQPAVGVVA